MQKKIIPVESTAKNSYKGLNVLLIQVELPKWRRARHWSYTVHLGMEEGLKANRVEHFTLTTPWFPRAPEILKGRKFDQVWINDLAHLGDLGNISDPELEWIASIAPVRIGFLVESIEYSSEEYEANPWLTERRHEIEKRLKYVTHVVACDEKDPIAITEHMLLPAVWSPSAVPERFICKRVSKAQGKFGLFGGAPYGERANWLERPDLKSFLIHELSPENRTLYPLLFNCLPAHRANRLVSKRTFPSFIYPIYIHSLRCIRRRCFQMWLRGMLGGSAVVNLPHWVKCYPGRVIEAMAAGRPVISWEIPDRPQNRALFNDGEEILLYSRNDSGQLASHIKALISNPELGRRIAQKARIKIIRFHTIEKRIQQILNWVESGEMPIYN